MLLNQNRTEARERMTTAWPNGLMERLTQGASGTPSIAGNA